jgi:hypothetical protein
LRFPRRQLHFSGPVLLWALGKLLFTLAP